jgi:hypothetical protein
MNILHEAPVLGAIIAAAIFMIVMVAVSLEDALKH